MPMIAHRKLHNLARLEIGLRTDASRLVELERELILVLQRGRGLGAEYGSPGDWNTAWGHHWDLVGLILRRIHALVAELQGCINSSGADRPFKALETWTALKLEDARLVQTLGALHGQAVGLNLTAQEKWEVIAKTMAAHLDIIHACAGALHIKLELLKNNSSAEVAAQVQKLLNRLARPPQSRRGTAINDEEEYQQAAVELQQEQNQFMGFIDVVKGLLTWVETPQERADKNLDSAALHRAGVL